MSYNPNVKCGVNNMEYSLLTQKSSPTFLSPSAAADVVTQGYVSGNKYWIDADGKN